MKSTTDMRRQCRLELTLVLTMTVLLAAASSAQNTVGTTLISDDVSSGYVLFSPNSATQTYLIDRCGRTMNQWESDGRPGLSAYLLEDGSLLRTRKLLTGAFIGGGIGGMLERFNWNGELIWSDTLATESIHQHHDIAPMPNGNILAILWEKYTAEEAIANGRDPLLTPEEVWVTRIVELSPMAGGGSEIIWSWSPWDHLIQHLNAALPHYGEPANFPHRFDVNYGAVAEVVGPGIGQDAAFDWLHVNSIDYHAERDEIALSSRNWDEVWVIDHSTTTAEAASSTGGSSNRGGDILWRWGNPLTYGVGAQEDRQFFGQHDAQFIEDGLGITVYNNGANRPEGPFSTVHLIEFPLDTSGSFIDPDGGVFGPDEPNWTYPDEPDLTFFSNNISGYQRMANGHHLICQGADGRFFELNEAHQLVWEYINPMTTNGPLSQGSNPNQNSVFRATHIALEHPGILEQDLSPGDPIELNPDLADCFVNSVYEVYTERISPTVWPIPSRDFLHIEWPETMPMACEVVFYTPQGIECARTPHGTSMRVDIQTWPPGLYIGILQRCGDPFSSQAPLTFKFIIQ
jgi:hypothetical protein